MIFSNELLTFIGWCSEYWVTVAIEYFGNDPDSEGLETFVRGSKKMNHVWKLLILLIFVFTEFFIAESLSCCLHYHHLLMCQNPGVFQFICHFQNSCCLFIWQQLACYYPFFSAEKILLSFYPTYSTGVLSLPPYHPD